MAAQGARTRETRSASGGCAAAAGETARPSPRCPRPQAPSTESPKSQDRPETRAQEKHARTQAHARHALHGPRRSRENPTFRRVFADIVRWRTHCGTQQSQTRRRTAEHRHTTRGNPSRTRSQSVRPRDPEGP
eukprot:Amastigsp_a514962_52.p5 type:complete len:133 gc:universal Amastigsp_a514962_52:1104-1502(+)